MQKTEKNFGVGGREEEKKQSLSGDYLSQETLARYPEFATITNAQSIHDIIEVARRGDIISYFLSRAEQSNPTGGVEYNIQWMRENLERLIASEPALTKFIADYTKILEDLERRAKTVIGNKVRGQDGVYRAPGERDSIIESPRDDGQEEEAWRENLEQHQRPE